MVSSEMLLSYTYWTIPFTVHTVDHDKQLGAVIIDKKNPLPYSQEY